ncbi:MAG TPA: hypothetical protein VGX28_12565 [Frankiaceae bacterium]|nr:hypothetical protein [Frankiaceae bacterium]
MTRSLTLKRETLTPLTAAELGGVAAGATTNAITAIGRTCPVLECAGLESWVGHCPTLPECP